MTDTIKIDTRKEGAAGITRLCCMLHPKVFNSMKLIVDLQCGQWVTCSDGNVLDRIFVPNKLVFDSSAYGLSICADSQRVVPVTGEQYLRATEDVVAG